MEDRCLLSYAITDLGAFTAYGLNNAGQVVGYNDGAVLWQNGGLVGLGAANSSNALAVNDAGRVAGYRILGGSNFHAFVWDPSLGFTDLGTLPNSPYSQAADLNEVGQVVGRSQGTNTSSSLDAAHAFLWDPSNGMQDLGIPGSGVNSSTATAINESGQVVGFSQSSFSGMTTFATNNAAFFRDSSGATTLLGTLPGQLYSKALDINDLGQVVGSSGDREILPHSVLYRPQEAFVWQNGVMTGLGKPAGYLRSEAVANNNAGQVVGFAYSSTSNGYYGHAFLWENGASTDLGFSYPFSVDINDRGQILVVASVSNQNHSYLLNPDTITTLAVSDVTVTEGNAGTMTAVFTVTRSGPSDQITTVNYATANGTASAASDYAAASGAVTFNLGETSKTIAVVVNGDTLNEANESFFVNLSNPVNGFVADSQGVGTILNDDPVPAITINDVAQVEGNSGISYFVFTVSLSAASGQTVTVNFATANGTATVSGNDYLATSGTLTFAPGETTKTILVAVKGDTKKEANETFFLNLSGALNALILDAQGLGTILNDD